MLYITSQWFIYFITGSLYFLILFPNFNPPPALAATCLFSVCISLFLFPVCFVF